MPKQIDDSTIFQATLDMLLAHGYGGATTKLIAEAADVHEVTLFRRYGNKAQLVVQAIGYQAEQSDFRQAMVYTGDVAADLHRVLVAFAESAKFNGEFIPIILSEMARYPALREALRVPLSMATGLGTLLGRYQQEGVLQVEDELQSVTALLGPLIFRTMLEKAHGAEGLAPLDLATMVRGFLQGRQVPKSG